MQPVTVWRPMAGNGPDYVAIGIVIFLQTQMGSKGLEISKKRQATAGEPYGFPGCLEFVRTQK